MHILNHSWDRTPMVLRNEKSVLRDVACRGSTICRLHIGSFLAGQDASAQLKSRYAISFLANTMLQSAQGNVNKINLLAYLAKLACRAQVGLDRPLSATNHLRNHVATIHNNFPAILHQAMGMFTKDLRKFVDVNPNTIHHRTAGLPTISSSAFLSLEFIQGGKKGIALRERAASALESVSGGASCSTRQLVATKLARRAHARGPVDQRMNAGSGVSVGQGDTNPGPRCGQNIYRAQDAVVGQGLRDEVAFSLLRTLQSCTVPLSFVVRAMARRSGKGDVPACITRVRDRLIQPLEMMARVTQTTRGTMALWTDRPIDGDPSAHPPQSRDETKLANTEERLKSSLPAGTFRGCRPYRTDFDAFDQASTSGGLDTDTVAEIHKRHRTAQIFWSRETGGGAEHPVW
jgi:hypothetical protein